MRIQLRFACLLSLVLGSVGISTGTLLAQDNADKPQAGVEVLARGPVHEAYAQPIDAAAQPGIIVPKRPPDPIAELPPDEKPSGDNVQWIPGYWGWDSDRKDFLWVSGFWRAIPPSRKWVPGHWTQVEGGWQWVTGFWASASKENIQYLDPPPPPVDSGPSTPAPGEDSIYVPGCWIFNSTRYFWRPGYWMNAQPGWVWTPSHYCYTPAGYVYVDGYWDYPLEDRGLLFAPVAFEQPLWQNSNWYYQPSCVVNAASLLSCLFVRPSYCHYYFGDFYSPNYAGLGFHPWFAYGQRHHDPLFGYYGWRHRNDFSSWYGGLRNTYVGRTRGDLPRPPHTFAQQGALVHQNFHNTNVNNLQIVKPLSQFRDGRVPLTHLSTAQATEHARAARQFQDVRVQRGGVERPTGSSGAPRTLSLANVPSPRSGNRAELNTQSLRPGWSTPATRPGSLGREFHSQPSITGLGHAPANVGRAPVPHAADLGPRTVSPLTPHNTPQYPYRSAHAGGSVFSPGRLPHSAAPAPRVYSHPGPGVIAPRPSYPHAATHFSSPARSFAAPRAVAPSVHGGGGHSGHHK